VPEWAWPDAAAHALGRPAGPTRPKRWPRRAGDGVGLSPLRADRAYRVVLRGRQRIALKLQVYFHVSLPEEDVVEPGLEPTIDLGFLSTGTPAVFRKVRRGYLLTPTH
jgi:hypothetical protein